MCVRLFCLFQCSKNQQCTCVRTADMVLEKSTNEIRVYSNANHCDLEKSTRAALLPHLGSLLYALKFVQLLANSFENNVLLQILRQSLVMFLLYPRCVHTSQWSKVLMQGRNIYFGYVWDKQLKIFYQSEIILQTDNNFPT